MILCSWLIGNAERGGRGEQEMWEGERKWKADRQIKRRMNGWVHGWMNGWKEGQSPERKETAAAENTSQNEGGLSFTFWAHDITLFFSILPFSPFFHICRADPFHAHTYTHSQSFGTVRLLVEARGTSASIRRLLCVSLSLCSQGNTSTSCHSQFVGSRCFTCKPDVTHSTVFYASYHVYVYMFVGVYVCEYM